MRMKHYRQVAIFTSVPFWLFLLGRASSLLVTKSAHPLRMSSSLSLSDNPIGQIATTRVTTSLPASDNETIVYEGATSEDDFLQILDLQRQNLPDNLSPAELQSQGFVTIQHDLATLATLNTPHPHIVARTAKDKIIIGYALSMLPEHRASVPFLHPILDEIDELIWMGRKMKTTRYCIMGQICIAKNFRGQGLFQGLYQEMIRQRRIHQHNEEDAPSFEFLVTGVATSNRRSFRAHEKMGFIPLIDDTTKTISSSVVSLEDDGGNPKQEEEFVNLILDLR